MDGADDALPSSPGFAGQYDAYSALPAAGSAGALAASRGLGQVGFWPKVAAHPAYASFWQEQAVDKLLLKEPPIAVPTLLVHSLWDQEDIYGNMAVWKAVKPREAAANVHLVLGPWFHHQERLDGSAIGAIRFGSNTAQYFRREILKPFLDRYLKDGAPHTDLPTVTAFETGSNRWERLDAWPQGCEAGCAIEARAIYLQPAGRLAFDKPAAPGIESYVSDPAKPVPFIPRPINLMGEEGAARWQSWLVSDQCEAASRPDVLVFETAPLTAPLKIAGEPVANLAAATTGTDGDFVVKLIDVYPDQMGREPGLGGYQLMVSADILRGRYRESFSNPKPIAAGERLVYRFGLPPANHVFLTSHRIMVQVQSSWFPLYDMNPQSYAPNIFFRLDIAGLVERPATLTFKDLQGLPERRVETFHQCAGAPRRPDLPMRRVGHGVWHGVDLAELLRRCGVSAGARFLWAYGLDHGEYDGVNAGWYVKDMPLTRLDQGGVLLAYAVNGEPLTAEHGFPLRLVIPGYYGTNAVKWLWRLELAAERAPSPFTTVLYNDPDPVAAGATRPVWEAPPESLIVAPVPGPLTVAPVAIWGWAWPASSGSRSAPMGAIAGRPRRSNRAASGRGSALCSSGVPPATAALSSRRGRPMCAAPCSRKSGRAMRSILSPSRSSDAARPTTCRLEMTGFGASRPLLCAPVRGP